MNCFRFLTIRRRRCRSAAARTLASLGVAALVALTMLAGTAEASRYVRFGIMDDDWLRVGPGGTLEERLDRLDSIGVDLVRYTLRWNTVAPTRPASPVDPSDPAYRWDQTDAILNGLRARGIAAVVTLWGTPEWANGGRGPSWAPSSPSALAGFAQAAATRYSAVRHWVVWNEPNKPQWLRPSSARVYTGLLNAAYDAIKQANPRALVGGGVTGPRGQASGTSPVAWIRTMGQVGARLDAYAHHPYPVNPHVETPWSGGCAHCATITMADLERLIREVDLAFGPKRIWLTEYGYQTNPPDEFLGVSPARQAEYVASASRRAYAAPRVDMLIQFMFRDDTKPGGWQSGLVTSAGKEKLAYLAWQLPLAQVSRAGSTTVVWGQVRPGSGPRLYRLQQLRSGVWRGVGGTRSTDSHGFFRRTVRAGPGSRFRVWSPRARIFSPVLRIR